MTLRRVFKNVLRKKYRVSNIIRLSIVSRTFITDYYSKTIPRMELILIVAESG